MPDTSTAARGIGDGGGLVCGFALSGAAAQALAAPADGAAGGIVWMHFNLADNRARRWIETAGLPEEARDLLLGPDDRARVAEAGPGIFGIVWDMVYDAGNEATQPGTLRFYCDRERLITARLHPLLATNRLRQELAAGPPPGGTIELLSRLIELMAESFDAVIAGLARSVDAIEDAILSERGHRDRVRLAAIRRSAAGLHRQVAAQPQALAHFLDRKRGRLDEAEQACLRAAVEELRDVVHGLDSILERSKLLLEEMAAQVAERTGNNLFVLSIVTVVLLPATLVTGVFGMNVAGLPGTEHPDSFWWVIGGMVAIAAGTLALLRWRGII